MKNRKPHTKPKLSPAQKEAIYALPLGKQFRIVHIDEGSGFAVYRHVLVDTEANDYKQVLTVAKAYARETPCAINPEVDKNAPLARAKIFPGIEDLANPDLHTEKYGYIDVKSPQRKSNIISNANDACKQGAIAVITDFFLGDTLSIYKAKSITFDIFFGRNIDKNGQRNYTKNEIHWFLGGTLHKLNKPEKN
ncbi:MAG: hypothetical protein NC048_09670 [Bacteroides sp.]|nr:hypothetical protein [Ruminococcus flavefaciens]MCM1555742.1 hypothetical protein [Bacteroides sp.]